MEDVLRWLGFRSRKLQGSPYESYDCGLVFEVSIDWKLMEWRHGADGQVVVFRS